MSNYFLWNLTFFILLLGMGTNLYGRFYCPGRPLDMGVREEIIRLFQQNMKVNQISKILKISHGCVSKIIKRLVFRLFYWIFFLSHTSSFVYHHLYQLFWQSKKKLWHIFLLGWSKYRMSEAERTIDKIERKSREKLKTIFSIFFSFFFCLWNKKQFDDIKQSTEKHLGQLYGIIQGYHSIKPEDCQANKRVWANSIHNTKFKLPLTLFKKRIQK